MTNWYSKTSKNAFNKAFPVLLPYWQYPTSSCPHRAGSQTFNELQRFQPYQKQRMERKKKITEILDNYVESSGIYSSPWRWDIIHIRFLSIGKRCVLNACMLDVFLWKNNVFVCSQYVACGYKEIEVGKC